MVKLNKFFIPYILFLILLGFKGEIIIAFIIVFAHELVHYITARCLGFSGFDIEILPMGTVLKLKELDEATPKEDFIISISGPMVNLAAAVIFHFFYRRFDTGLLGLLYTGNLAIGIFNLIPAFPLDGGRILRDFLSTRTLYKKANLMTIRISITLGIMMMFYYFILFFSDIYNINLGLIALFVIVSSMKEKERVVYLIMGDIVKKRYNFIKRGYIENKWISIHLKKDLITGLSLVDKNRYTVFTILDDEMNVLDIIYEEEIVEALKVYGNIILEELIKIRETNS